MNNIRFNSVAIAVATVLSASVTATAPISVSDKATDLKNFEVNGSINLSAKRPAHVLTNQSLSSDFVLKDQVDRRSGLKTFTWVDKSEQLKTKKRMSKSGNVGLNDKRARATIGTLVKQHGLSKTSVDDAKLLFADQHPSRPSIFKYQQMIDDREVFGRQLAVIFDREENPVAVSGYFSSEQSLQNMRSSNSGFKISAKKAFESALKNIGLKDVSVNTVLSKQSDGYDHYTLTAKQNSSITFSQSQRLKEVYFPVGESLVPGYYIEIFGGDNNSTNGFAFGLVISANDGKLLFRKNLIEHQDYTYRTYADNVQVPLDGPFGNTLTPHPTGNVDDPLTETVVAADLITLESGPISTQDPWLPDNATVTTGNNVDSYADISGPDGFNEGDIRPTTTAANTFDYVSELNEDSLSNNGRNAAAVNLFYVNNYLHDWFYDNGFNEAAGNAQQDNFGRGGLGNDRMRVEAQDSSGTNNANMSTPADGAPPRMQMYLFVSGSGVGLDIDGVGSFDAGTAQFGQQSFNLTGDAARLEDDTAPVEDGCEAVVNAADLTGKIAVIDRGTCAFTVKVKAAQDAGAVAAIVINDAPASDPDRGGIISMGGDDSTITIPSMFMSLEDGTQLLNAMDVDTVSITMARDVSYRDGTLDNGIVAHEWAHYLSNRLVSNASGLVNNMGRGMGEGWSDFVALMLTVKESDQSQAGNENFQGVYPVAGFATKDNYYGIRRVPYSTDMNKNGLTFRHIALGEALPDNHPVRYGQDGSSNNAVHATGEVWSTSLWEVYAALLNREDLTFAEAQNRMKNYLVAGLKMTPYAPTITEARDGILAAAYASDPDDFATILQAFARRGLGINAVSPERFSSDQVGVVEDFTAEGSAIAVQSMSIDTNVLTQEIKYCDGDNIWDAGETALLTVNLRNAGTTSLSGVTAELTSSNDITFADGSAVTFSQLNEYGDLVTAQIPVLLNSATEQEDVTITLTFNEIGNAPEDVIEPAPVNLTVTTNFDLAKTSQSENLEDTLTVDADWTLTASSNLLNKFELDGGVYDQFFGTGQMFYGDNNATAGSSSLVSPIVTVAETGAMTMSFFHYYEFESSENDQQGIDYLDGGVIEVSVDGGDWVDVTSIGGTIEPNYSGTVLESNPVIGSRQAFVGPIQQFGQSVTVSIPEGDINGSNLQFRFLIGTDDAIGSFGWLIDDIAFDNITNFPFSGRVTEDGVCENAPPVVDAIETISVSEKEGGEQRTVTLSAATFDHEGDSLTYSWTQTSGPNVSLENSDASSTSFVIPVVNQDSTFEFSVSVSDGSSATSMPATVEVTDVNDAPEVSISGVDSITEGESFTLSSNVTDDDTELTYQWQQVSGTSATIGSTTGASLSVESPSISEDETLVFELTVSDGETSTSTQKSVAVTNRSSGGGSLFWLVSGLLILCGFRSRK
ncbi:MAG: peptidase M36 [Gammaproteobacteria bacterium]|nr:peptidase M36 [Gammaproteobacteria bacterium]